MKPANPSTKQITMRTAQSEDDFWLVRQLLIDCWHQAPPFFNWEIRRWDGSYFHNKQPGFDARWDGGQSVGLWETADGRLVAAVHPESKGSAWLNINPAYRRLEPGMLDWAETQLPHPDQHGQQRLRVFCWEFDHLRIDLLQSRGYRKTGTGDVLREKPYNTAEPPSPRLPEGYRLHTVRPGNREDCERYARLLNDSFRRDFHTAQELITFTKHSPSFRSELELAAVAPDGSFAALTGMIYDADNRFGLFEPVCATQERRPLGLTGALMAEGYRRVRLLGAEHCYTGTGIGMAANRFYESCGFKIIQTGWMWIKEVP